MKNKVLEFVKNHKKELILSGLAIVGGTAIFIITKKKPDWIRKINPTFQTREEELTKIKLLDWKCGELTDLWKEGHFTNAIVNEITVEDLGKLGTEFLKLDDVTKNSTVSLVVGIGD